MRLLPDVGRVADDGVHLLQGDAPHRVARQGYVVQGDARLGVEEAGPGYAGIVRLVAQVADGEIYGGKLGREGGDVYPEYVGQQPFVGEGRPAGGLGQRALARVGPHQEGAAAARRVQHPVVRAADAEGVDEVHHVRRGVELAEPPALAAADQPLIHLPDHVEVQAGEVELLYAPDQPRPVPGG